MVDHTISDDETIGGANGALLANRYRVIRPLGQGGMGAVWLAEDTQLENLKVAIKTLPSVLVANVRAYQQLKSEALVSLKLTHPNIAAVRSFEENGGNPFLVVDYIDGETLDDRLADCGRMDEEETVRLLGPIAAALDYAHGAGVVHRDVKPGNVMIAKDGTPYILDFGIAREIQETMTRVTGKLSSGTLLYMSPEQLRGAVPKAAQDVYSFAAMVYECLTGKPPFSRGQIEYQILTVEPERLDTGIRIADSVMAGLAKKSDERPTSCADVLVSRRRARAPSMSPAAVCPPRRLPSGKIVAWGLAVAGVILALGVTFTLVNGNRARRAAVRVVRTAEERAAQLVEEIGGLSADDGFALQVAAARRRYEEGLELVARRDFAQARITFDEVAVEARRILQDDAERQRTVSFRREAKDARKRGVEARAREDAPDLWARAEKTLAEADRQKAEGRFLEASMLFAKARQYFEDAGADAVRVRQERERIARARQDCERETAIAAVRHEAGELIAACRAVRGALTNRVLACERLYDEAERTKDRDDLGLVARSYTNAVLACRAVLEEEARRKREEAERKAKIEKAERDRQRHQAEVEAHRRKLYPEYYANKPAKTAEHVQRQQLRSVVDVGRPVNAGVPRTDAECATRLVGRWACRYTVVCISDGMRMPENSPTDEVMELRANGSFVQTMNFNNQYLGTHSSRGTWTFSGGLLHVTLEGKPIDFRVIWKGGACFELRYADLNQYTAISQKWRSSLSSFRVNYDTEGNLVSYGKFRGFLGLGGTETTWINPPKVFRRR